MRTAYNAKGKKPSVWDKDRRMRKGPASKHTSVWDDGRAQETPTSVDKGVSREDLLLQEDLRRMQERGTRPRTE